MPRSRKSATDRKSEIIAAAVRLAGEHGPDRVTTQMLADAVGVTQPAIFRHFPAKTDIWLAVGQLIAQRLRESESDDPGDDPLQHLTGIITRHFGQIARNPAIPAILFSRELHAENEPLRQHFESVMVNRRAHFARLAGAAIDAGQLPAGNPEDTAALILATIQGLAMRWSLENRAFDLQAEGARLLDRLLNPLKSPQAPAREKPAKPKPPGGEAGPTFFGS